MWEDLKSVFLYWIGMGVTIFRVDNPHTKAFPFWEWVIAEIKRDRPEVFFLAEAFTRPKTMSGWLRSASASLILIFHGAMERTKSRLT